MTIADVSFEPLLTRSEVQEILNISSTGLYSAVRENPNFPQPIYVTPRSPRWRATDLRAYIDARSGDTNGHE